VLADHLDFLISLPIEVLHSMVIVHHSRIIVYQLGPSGLILGVDRWPIINPRREIFICSLP
jgi:hypothetical protein